MNETGTKKVYLVEKLQELGIKVLQLCILHLLSLSHKRNLDLLGLFGEKVSFGSFIFPESVLPDALEENCVDKHQASHIVKGV